ncbi:MAG: hypothetical protein AB8B96_12080 [Lysobacterales bacterium]
MSQHQIGADILMPGYETVGCSMVYVFIIGSLVSLGMNFRLAMQMPTEVEIAQLMAGDLRYRTSIISLFGSMCVSLIILFFAAYFSLAADGQLEPALLVMLLIYYPAYYWVASLGYSEILGIILERKFGIADPLLKPKLFAITRSRAQRVHAIVAVLLSMVFISNADAAERLSPLVSIFAVVGWLAWIPVNIAYFRATDKGASWQYPDALDSGRATVTIIVAGMVFHLMVGMVIPLLILTAPFLLPKILRRDKVIPVTRASN